MTDYRNYYVRHVMGRIGDLQFGVIGIGIALLALNYLGLVTMTDLAVFQLDVFWRRVALLALVIVFAAYCAIVYNAYGLRAIDDHGKPLSVNNPFRLFVMFLLDIAHLTIIAAMYGVLYIPDTWNLINSEACRVSLQQCLALGSNETGIIFVLGAMWHGVVATWYLVSDGRSMNVANHVGFMMAYGLAVVLGIFTAWFDGWISVLAFLAIIVGLLVVQGRRWLVDLDRAASASESGAPADRGGEEHSK